MKKFLLFFCGVTFFLIMGCAENPLYQPVQSITQKDNLLFEETIELCCILDDPAGGLCQFIGKVEYVHQIVSNQPEEDELYLISLTLNMNSGLCMLYGPKEIDCQTQDTFYVSEEGIYILTKAYCIENRMDIVLVVQYLVTTEGAGIPNLWLQEID